MSPRILCLMLATFLCIDSISFADQFGNVIFTTPEGWSRVKQGDSMLLIPNDVPNKAVFTLAITGGEDLKGRTLKQFLEDMLAMQLSTGGRVISTAPVEESKISSGIPVLSTTRVMATREGNAFLDIHFVLQAGSRGEVVTVISNSQEVVRKYSDVVGRFIATLGFANVPKSPAVVQSATTKGNARIDGLYIHLVRSTDKLQFHGEGRLFYFDGRVYRGIPTGGLNTFDWDQALKKSPGGAGHYVLNKKGNEGILNFEWGDKKRDEEKIIFTDLGFTSGPDEWQRVSRVSSGQVVGRWERVPSTDSAPLAEIGTKLEFHADGTFNSSGATGKAKVEEKGRFIIDDFSIRFVSDKSSRTFTFFAYGNPVVINIDGADFIRQNKK